MEVPELAHDRRRHARFTGSQRKLGFEGCSFLRRYGEVYDTGKRARKVILSCIAQLFFNAVNNVLNIAIQLVGGIFIKEFTVDFHSISRVSHVHLVAAGALSSPRI